MRFRQKISLAPHSWRDFRWKEYLATAYSTSRFTKARCSRSTLWTIPALSWGREKPVDLRSISSCPEAERAAYNEAVWFPHQLFLCPIEDIDAIADAVLKVLANIEERRDLDHKAIRNQKLGRADRES